MIGLFTYITRQTGLPVYLKRRHCWPCTVYLQQNLHTHFHVGNSYIFGKLHSAKQNCPTSALPCYSFESKLVSRSHACLINSIIIEFLSFRIMLRKWKLRFVLHRSFLFSLNALISKTEDYFSRQRHHPGKIGKSRLMLPTWCLLAWCGVSRTTNGFHCSYHPLSFMVP